MEEKHTKTLHVEDHDMAHEAFYMEPVFWVAVAFIIFVALVIKPLSKFVSKALDSQSARIAAELTEARRLRAEAEEILASFQKKQRESLQEAEDMLAETKADAALIMEKAGEDLKVALEKRMKMATDKIALAEARAVQDVQGYVADIALKAANQLIAEHLGKGGNDELVKKAITDMAAKIH